MSKETFFGFAAMTRVVEKTAEENAIFLFRFYFKQAIWVITRLIILKLCFLSGNYS